MRRAVASIVALLLVGAWASVSWGQQPQRSIEHVRGALYRFQDNQHFGVYYITEEGAVVLDPINEGVAEWLIGEIDRRHDTYVRFVLYSHFHADHVAGGAAFGSRAIVIANERTAHNLVPPAPEAGLDIHDATLDTNEDDRLQRNELAMLGADYFASLDLDQDGALSAQEAHLGFFSDVRSPELLISGRQQLVLGNKTIEMIPVGGGHADDMHLVFFPVERVLYAVDIMAAHSLPYSYMTGFDEGDYACFFQTALALPFEILAPGHGPIGDRAALEAHRDYILELTAAVRDLVAEGRSEDDLVSTLDLSSYREWRGFELWREQNIRGLYEYITRQSALSDANAHRRSCSASPETPQRGTF